MKSELQEQIVKEIYLVILILKANNSPIDIKKINADVCKNTTNKFAK